MTPTYVPAAQASSVLEKLVSMTGAEVSELGNVEQERLMSLTRSAARHERTPSPALPDNADDSVASMTAMV